MKIFAEEVFESHRSSSPEGGAALESLLSLLSRKSAQVFMPLIEEDGIDVWNLRFRSGLDLFSEEEYDIVRQIQNCPKSTFSTPSRHVVIILKATRLCNLRCTYCHSWRSGAGNVMPLQTLAKISHQVLSSPHIDEVDFVWHGGEVTLLPIEYVERALWIQQQYATPRMKIVNSLQTNATRITPEWIELFKKYRVNIGVSIDGPPEVHDLRRVDKKGRGTSAAVQRGISMLQASGLRVGALAVVDECVIKLGARAYLEYLVDLKVPAVALLNALPSNSIEDSDESWLPWRVFSDFLRELFEVWWRDYRSAITVRELQSLVNAVKTGYTGLCIYRENCMGRYLTIEPNGDVSACDKYVGDPDFTFGNIETIGLGEMMRGSTKLASAIKVVDDAKLHTSGCPEYAICSGGCPHDVRLRQLHGKEGQVECCGLRSLIGDVRNTIL